ncbi:hypothetical protein DFH07DRAFT_775564 [Mycena maculata]|uniref:Uncharacterized protein n=1 Tax=Mycena maculata TaxID=230809 RepID=A0AAD7ISY4_9AGAR|nr:hypothetical protein DFH07DRAFT_775564 [Mycena maculata]
MSSAMDKCPLCGSPITQPRPSEGHHTPSNEGRYYQRTLVKIAAASLTGGTTFLRSSLNHSLSLSPVTLRTPHWNLYPRQLAFPNFRPIPLPPPRPPRADEQRCSHVSIQTAPVIPRVTAIQNVFGSSTPERCPAPRHNETVSVLNSVTVAARNSGTVAAASHTLANPTLIPFTYEKPMARMVDVSYTLKLQRGDHEPAVSDRFQRKAYRKAKVNAVKARVWLKTGGESTTVVLTVGTFPWFHPQDCPPLMSLLDTTDTADWSTFGYWDPADHWVLTDAPIEIKDAQSILCLRLPNVKDCIDGPRPKSRLSDVLYHFPSTNLSDQFLSRELSYAQAANRPTKPITQPSIEDADNTDNSDIEIVTPLPTPPTASSKSTPKSKFPLKYAYQMNQGFMDMAAATAGTIERKFEAAFDMPWTRSSYYTHHDVWSAMCKDNPDALAYAVQCGACPGGEWGPIAQRFAKSKGKGTKSIIDVPRNFGVKISDLSFYCTTLWLQSFPASLQNISLRPTPQNYPTAVKMLSKLPGLEVSWPFILQGTGPHSNEKSGPVDLKLRELFKMGLISIPVEYQHLSSSTEDPPTSSQLDPLTSSESGSPGQKIRIPTPMPETRLKRWKGSLEEYKKEHDLIWDFVSHDPGADVKRYDPKIVVVDLLGDDHHESLVTRYHELDLSDAIRFHGRRLEDDDSDSDSEDESSELEITTLEDLDPNSLITVTVLTQEIVRRAVLTKPFTDAHGEEDFVVSWVLPGYPIISFDGVIGDVLYIHHHDDAPVGQFAERIDEEHLLPTLGPLNALRVLLFVAPYQNKVGHFAVLDLRTILTTCQVKELSESEKKNNLIAVYLGERHTDDSVLKEIQINHTSRDLKTKGQTPQCWERWTTKLKKILDYEDQIPNLYRVAGARKKKITAKAIGLLVHTSGDWVSKCLTAAQLIQNHRTKVWLIQYLQKNDVKSAVGIDSFIKELRKGLDA